MGRRPSPPPFDTRESATAYLVQHVGGRGAASTLLIVASGGVWLAGAANRAVAIERLLKGRRDPVGTLLALLRAAPGKTRSTPTRVPVGGLPDRMGAAEDALLALYRECRFLEAFGLKGELLRSLCHEPTAMGLAVLMTAESQGFRSEYPSVRISASILAAIGIVVGLEKAKADAREMQLRWQKRLESIRENAFPRIVAWMDAGGIHAESTREIWGSLSVGIASRKDESGRVAATRGG